MINIIPCHLRILFICVLCLSDFRDYKSFSGKINTYALRAQAMPRHYAVKVVEDCHHHWQSLHIDRKQSTVFKAGDTNAITAPATVEVVSDVLPTDVSVNENQDKPTEN